MPVDAREWAPLGDLLEARNAPEPPDAGTRATRFAERNTPIALERLAHEFFARVDLTKPELADVRKLWEQKQHAAALDASPVNPSGDSAASGSVLDDDGPLQAASTNPIHARVIGGR